MRLKIEATVFLTSSNEMQVIRLLDLVTSGRHEWIADAASVRALESYVPVTVLRGAPAILDAARKSLQATTAYGFSAGGAVEVDASTLGACVEDLSRAAVLVVEDIVTDRLFIECVAKVLKHEAAVTALARGWLEVAHGGGGRIRDVALSIAGKYQRVTRVMVLLDSDRLNPGDRTRQHELADDLTSRGIGVHVLEWREAENYLPN